MLRPGKGPTTGLGAIFEPPADADVGEELRDAFRDDAQEHGLVVEGDLPFIEWVREVPDPKRPLDLDRMRFQVEPFYSGHAEIARLIRYMKAAQIGASAGVIRWALRHADRGRTVLYAMPKERQATEFS